MLPLDNPSKSSMVRIFRGFFSSFFVVFDLMSLIKMLQISREDPPSSDRKACAICHNSVSLTGNLRFPAHQSAIRRGALNSFAECFKSGIMLHLAFQSGCV